MRGGAAAAAAAVAAAGGGGRARKPKRRKPPLAGAREEEEEEELDAATAAVLAGALAHRVALDFDDGGGGPADGGPGGGWDTTGAGVALFKGAAAVTRAVDRDEGPRRVQAYHAGRAIRRRAVDAEAEDPAVFGRLAVSGEGVRAFAAACVAAATQSRAFRKTPVAIVPHSWEEELRILKRAVGRRKRKKRKEKNQKRRAAWRAGGKRHRPRQKKKE